MIRSICNKCNFLKFLIVFFSSGLIAQNPNNSAFTLVNEESLSINFDYDNDIIKKVVGDTLYLFMRKYSDHYLHSKQSYRLYLYDMKRQVLDSAVLNTNSNLKSLEDNYCAVYDFIYTEGKWLLLAGREILEFRHQRNNVYNLHSWHTVFPKVSEHLCRLNKDTAVAYMSYNYGYGKNTVFYKFCLKSFKLTDSLCFDVNGIEYTHLDGCNTDKLNGKVVLTDLKGYRVRIVDLHLMQVCDSFNDTDYKFDVSHFEFKGKSDIAYLSDKRARENSITHVKFLNDSTWLLIRNQADSLINQVYFTYDVIGKRNSEWICLRKNELLRRNWENSDSLLLSPAFHWLPLNSSMVYRASLIVITRGIGLLELFKRPRVFDSDLIKSSRSNHNYEIRYYRFLD